VEQRAHCAVHRHNIAELYCTDCDTDQIACLQCIAVGGRHANHRHISIAEADAQVAREYASMLSSIDEGRKSAQGSDARRVGFDEAANPKPSAGSCTQHSSIAAKFFCKTCSLAFCVDCVLVHKSHDFVDYNGALEGFQERLGVLASHMDKFDRVLERKLKATDVKAQMELKKQQDAVQSTAKQFEVVIQLLQSAQQRFCRSANEAASIVSDASNADCERTKQVQHQLKDIRERTSALRNPGELSALTAELHSLETCFCSLQTDFKGHDSNQLTLASFSIDYQLTLALAGFLAKANDVVEKLENDKFNFLNL
jgi:hypothetical protein